MTDEPTHDEDEQPATEPDDGALPAPDGDFDEVFGMQRGQAVRIAQVSLVVLVLAIVGIIVLTRGSGDDGTKGGSASAEQDKADGDSKSGGKPTWPAEIGGRPSGLGSRGDKAPAVTVAATVKPGAYLWSDYDGWHLWVVGGAGVPEITGTLTSNDAVAKAELATPGAGTVEVKGKVVNFTIPAASGIGGIDFNPGFFAKQLVFTLNGPDGPLDAPRVHLGAKAVQAPFPLVIAKS